jgi:hypothetical protein
VKLTLFRLKSISKLDQIRNTCTTDEEYAAKLAAMMNQVKSGGAEEEEGATDHFDK